MVMFRSTALISVLLLALTVPGLLRGSESSQDTSEPTTFAPNQVRNFDRHVTIYGRQVHVNILARQVPTLFPCWKSPNVPTR